jgi:DNA polymerase III epsilon subunit-like protein
MGSIYDVINYDEKLKIKELSKKIKSLEVKIYHFNSLAQIRHELIPKLDLLKAEKEQLKKEKLDIIKSSFNVPNKLSKLKIALEMNGFEV